MNKVIQGDCLVELKTLEENSVDSIVTDPPYELGFMGKSWDKSGIAYNVDMWKECLRVLKPGGHLLAFSGTRTYHRMASAIEDAGFEVRDMIEWVTGSGFPKSLNIGKAVDKLQGNERIKTGEIKHHAQKGVVVAEERGAIGGGAFGQAKDEEITKGTSEWEGWGTALKPAHEPICMARKPLAEKTVAENVLKYGTGGINIDESRVGTSDNLNGGGYNTKGTSKKDLSDATSYATKVMVKEFAQPEGRFPANLIHDNSEEVRECFPESVSKQAPRGGQGFHNAFGRPDRERLDGEIPKGHNDSGNASRFFKSIPIEEQDEIQEECTSMEEKLEKLGFLPEAAKSIIYQAKASKSERNAGLDVVEDENKRPQGEAFGNGSAITEHSERKGNFHPTVKPIALMEYLIKMVTPKGGIVLDPFAGSGSTLVAAKNNGYQYIGIEMTAEYIPIIKARLNGECN